MADVFNEESLHDEIIRIWGVHGAHNDVFTFMLKEIEALREVVRQLKDQSSEPGVIMWGVGSRCDQAYDRAVQHE